MIATTPETLMARVRALGRHGYDPSLSRLRWWSPTRAARALPCRRFCRNPLDCRHPVPAFPDRLVYCRWRIAGEATSCSSGWASRDRRLCEVGSQCQRVGNCLT